MAYFPRGELISNHWKPSDLKAPCCLGERRFTVCSLIQPTEGNLSVSCSEMFVRLVHKFLVFVPQPRSGSGIEKTFLKGAIVTLARLDAYLASVVTCINDDGTNKAGVCRKKFLSRKVCVVSLKDTQSTRCWHQIVFQEWLGRS